MKALRKIAQATRRVGGVLAAGLAVVGCAAAPVQLAPRAPASAAPLSPLQRADAERQLVVTIRDSRSALSIEAGATPTLPLGRLGYRGSAFALRVVRQLGNDYGLTPVTDWYIDTLGVHCVVFSASDATARDVLLQRLRADRRVESAQPMQQFRTLQQGSVAQSARDPYEGLQRAAARIGVPEAQRWASGRGVRIAVIDTGLDDAHPELAGRIEAVANFVDSDHERFRRDRHGTAVAGAIAANAHNSAGMIGVAPQARLVALKACWEVDGAGAAVCNSLTLAAAIEAAIERRVQLINLSLTGPADPLLARLLGHALERGVTVVGAAPPGQAGTTAAAFPGDVPGVVAVVDSDTLVASFQGVSARPQPRRIAAPGRAVLTLAPGGRYDYVSGVSMSTALVSGVAALLLEVPAVPGSSPQPVANMAELLLRTGVVRGEHEAEINAGFAMQVARGLAVSQK